MRLIISNPCGLLCCISHPIQYTLYTYITNCKKMPQSSPYPSNMLWYTQLNLAHPPHQFQVSGFRCIGVSSSVHLLDFMSGWAMKRERENKTVNIHIDLRLKWRDTQLYCLMTYWLTVMRRQSLKRKHALEKKTGDKQLRHSLFSTLVVKTYKKNWKCEALFT